MDVLDPLTGRFLDTVRDWLKSTNDPRLTIEADGSVRIADLANVCADFCEHMAVVAEKGESITIGKWNKLT